MASSRTYMTSSFSGSRPREPLSGGRLAVRDCSYQPHAGRRLHHALYKAGRFLRTLPPVASFCDNSLQAKAMKDASPVSFTKTIEI